MTGLEKRYRNHYLPRVYLRQWADSHGELWVYRTLVSHAKVPHWKRHQPGSIAYHLHLYSRATSKGESDEVERWLDSAFEAPAGPALQRATSDERMSHEDWYHLIRFFAAQDVRTPRRLLESLAFQEKQVPALLQSSLEECVRELEASRASPPRLTAQDMAEGTRLLPMRTSHGVDEETGHSAIEAEVVIGRGCWLFGIKTLLERTAKVLHNHRWTVLKAPGERQWVTSDGPSLRLNYWKDGQYDFGGGWGRPGTELMMPLSPTHLLYTQVGTRQVPARGTVLPTEAFDRLQQLIVAHAYRLILSKSPDNVVTRLRPRIVDSQKSQEEREHWRSWPADQASAERAMETRGTA